LRRRRVGLSRGEEEERKGEKGRLTSGTQLSAKGKKRKEEGGGMGWRGEWLMGRWARKEGR
jgi:hypothetical protein